MTFLVTQSERPAGDFAGVLTSAETCLESWRSRGVSNRGRVAAAAAGALYRRKHAHVRLLSIEKSQRIEQSDAEVDLSVDIMDYYAKCALGLCARSHLAPLSREKGSGREARVVIHVQPSRFPYFSLAGFVALNLTIGNVVVLTHAQKFPRCAVALEHLWLRAGAPVGVFTNVAAANCQALTSSDEVPDYRSAPICGHGAAFPQLIMTPEACNRPPALGLFRQTG
ncbi:aldehyde dehydrogenase family protein [Lichenihabitans psoromatis]|uniref:aldehyde dehydrogenase family protein n=1 Tax=Lichenihabitans psoromatis TaxID=2528642 RepID=UPI0010357999|nr:aldehyde dehydrogenase family protein [Lichenihabitans psoromatis]